MLALSCSYIYTLSGLQTVLMCFKIKNIITRFCHISPLNIIYIYRRPRSRSIWYSVHRGVICIFKDAWWWLLKYPSQPAYVCSTSCPDNALSFLAYLPMVCKTPILKLSPFYTTPCFTYIIQLCVYSTDRQERPPVQYMSSYVKEIKWPFCHPRVSCSICNTHGGEKIRYNIFAKNRPDSQVFLACL